MARTCIVPLLLAFSAFSAYVNAVIDCGGTGVYTDENMVVWIGDENSMNMGESHVVQTTTGVPHVMTTLRVFTSLRKNCYTLDATKGDRVLVRASFYYGNYDKKSFPPTFDLLFDSNLWVTVQTLLDQVISTEISYVVKSNATSICLAQTEPDQFPFISALEIRTLDTGVYNVLDPSYALLTKTRVAYGANQTIRYQNDRYDRVWKPARLGSGLLVVQNSADTMFIDVSADIPPTNVFDKAITTSSTAESIILSSIFPAGETPIYVNMYFSEMTQLKTTQKRSFQVFADDKSVDTVVPTYGDVAELNIFNITATPNTSFSLIATPDSTLPPLVNAMEIFSVYGPMDEGTDSRDVEGLSVLQLEFLTGTLHHWSGDPCLPSPYSWEWINCSSDPVPRVTALNLGSFGLSGILSNFSSMDALEIIDLHNNSISGPIPDFLGAFPNLKVLNLADNHFSGPIPTSISNNKKLKLQVSGNPKLCATGESCRTSIDTPSGNLPSSGDDDGSSRNKKKSKVPIIVGITIPAVLAFWAIVGFLVVSHNKRKRAAVSAAGTTGGPSGPNGTPPQVQGVQNNPSEGKVREIQFNDIRVHIQDQATN